MSARKIASSDPASAGLTVQTPTTQLTLPASAVRVRRNGIEFHSDKPIQVWTEMGVKLETRIPKSEPSDFDLRTSDFTVECSGVVVACTGNRHAGYEVSLLFPAMTPHAKARLDLLGYSTLA